MQLQEQALLTRKVRCLHVGNVPGTATPERLRDFVNCLMVRDELVTAPGDSVLKVGPLPEHGPTPDPNPNPNPTPTPNPNPKPTPNPNSRARRARAS